MPGPAVERQEFLDCQERERKARADLYLKLDAIMEKLAKTREEMVRLGARVAVVVGLLAALGSAGLNWVLNRLDRPAPLAVQAETKR
jgi:hypothetical protein